MPRQHQPSRADFFRRGERLLSAIERVVEDCNELIALVEKMKTSFHGSETEYLETLSCRIIADYSMRSAIAGGITSLPALLPGAGSAVALVGGAMVDMTFMLKHDVEMILCLSYLHGYDIRSEKERWLAYVLAGLRTYDLQARRNFVADLFEVQLEALPKYTPRELFKLAATVLGKLALRGASRGVVKAVPLVGMAVSASTNSFLTTSTGWWCFDALGRRRAADGDYERDPAAVDAVVR